MKYSGWVSLEAFDFSRDPIQLASNSIQHLRSQLAAGMEKEAVAASQTASQTA